jgi:hypothetical protein
VITIGMMPRCFRRHIRSKVEYQSAVAYFRLRPVS